MHRLRTRARLSCLVLAAAIAGVAGCGSVAAPAQTPAGAAASAGAVGMTWTLDGTSWTPVAGAGPPGLSGPTMSYDPDGQSVVLYGGVHSTDTWTWNGAWTHANPATNPGVPGGAMVFDAAMHELLFVDETIRLWAWDGRTWTRSGLRGPTGQLYTGTEGTHVSAGYDSATGALIVLANNWSTHPPTSTYDTWEWVNSTWKMLGEQQYPLNKGPDSADGELPYDASSKRLISVGNGASRATWTWSGTRWQPSLEPFWTGGPAAYDSALSAVVTVTACSADGFNTCGNGQHVWKLTSGTWTELDVSGPSPADVEAMAYDDQKGVLVVFGCSELACPPPQG